MPNQTLTQEQSEALLQTLKARFEKHMERHKELKWENVQKRLEAKPEKLWSLHQMETSGGEPDAIGQESSGAYVFFVC